MGNKSSTHRKDFDESGEIRGRSRSFNGLSSKFRRRSKSPPRERSSSFTENRPPKRGSFRTSSQNGFLKQGKERERTPQSSPSKPIGIKTCVRPIAEEESLKYLSSSAPTRARHFPPLESPTITILDSNVKDTLGRDTLRRAVTRKESESPRLSAKQMRQISQDLLGEKLAGIAKRRGLAVQNRDLSLSQASLSRMSCKSKSLHSLGSADIDFDNTDLNEVKESKYGKIVLRQNIGTSPPGEDYFEQFSEESFRSRTNSAPALDLIKRDRRNNQHNVMKNIEQKNSERSLQLPHEGQRSDLDVKQRSPEEVVQARRMLVFRALKTESDDLGIPDRRSIPVLMDKRTSPRRSGSPGQRSVNSVSPIQNSRDSVSPINRSLSPVRAVSPVSDKSKSPGNRGHSPGYHREQSPSNLRSSSPDLPKPLVFTDVRRNSSPNLYHSPREGSAVKTPEKCNRPTPMKASPTKRALPNIDEYKILGTSAPGTRSEVWGSYESLTIRSKKDDDVNDDDDNPKLRERSRSISLTSRESSADNNECISPLDNEDSGFRGRSNSWSVLRERSKLPNMGTTSAFIQQKSINRLWSYSVTSLTETGLDHSLQTRRHQRYLEDTRGPDDLDELQELRMDSHTPLDTCPVCHLPFDKGKKRKLIDSCGHAKCYTCMFSFETCPLCEAYQNSTNHPRQHSDVTHYSGRPKMKTNGHFTPLMHRHDTTDGHTQATPNKSFNTYGAQPPSSNIPQPQVPSKPRFFRPIMSSPPATETHPQLPPPPKSYIDANRYYSSDSAIGSPDLSGNSVTMTTNYDLDELSRLDREGPSLDLHNQKEKEKQSPPPPPPDVAQHDLMMRLGLLLGDRNQGNELVSSSISPICQANQTEETFTSVSSLGSSEHTPDRGISDTSPLSTLTASSGSERGLSGIRMGTESLFPVHVRDPSTESMVSFMSTSTGQSMSPHTTTQRPHSITTSTPGQIEDLGLFGARRKSPIRRSARATVGHHDSRVRITPIKPPQIRLNPIPFEVPHPEGKALFVGREWLYKEVDMALNSEPTLDATRGVILTGGIGSGKTAIIEQLVDCSCFTDGRSGLVEGSDSHRIDRDRKYHNGIDYSPTSTLNNMSNLSASLSNLTYDALRSLGSQVVAYHFCQADNNITCLVPEFVHSLAARLVQAPQLMAYRELVMQDMQLQHMLSLKECVQNPSEAFIKGIMEPLKSLKEAGKITHVGEFPRWLKLVVTVHTVLQDITKTLPFGRIAIDRDSANEMIARDLEDYVNHRVETSTNVKNNITLNGRLEPATQVKFCKHLQTLSKGSFLFCKLTLDLIEKGHLVLKSSNYKILPVNISEVFLLHFNLKFQSVRSFEKVSPILGVCLATLYPLKAQEIYETINCGYTENFITPEDFTLRMEMLSGFLFHRRDDCYMFFHPAFREWLIRRDDADNAKFLCDLRQGHALMAFHLSRVCAPLGADKTIELGHHILKAHIYKNISKQRGYSSRDMQAYWMALSAENLNASLASHRNLFSPNVKVSRLILLSGANPNTRAPYNDNSPVLCIAAKEGFMDMVGLLLEFNANADAVSDTGMSALCYAAAEGHCEILKMLCLKNARLSHVDKSGQCPAVHAAMHGHLEALAYLLQCDWSAYDGQLTKTEAMQQALVAAAATGHCNIIDYLVRANMNMVEGFGLTCCDTLLGETAMTAACSHGQKDTVSYLIDQGSSMHQANAKSFTPLLCAVDSGRWEIADMLLGMGAPLEQTDKYGRTSLMIASYKGHIGVLEMLLSRGASIHQVDKEGLTSLCWGCLKGHLHIIQVLLDRGSNIHHVDRCGRTPLQLASFSGDVQVVQYLIERGAQMEHADVNGMRALDRAIDRRNSSVVMCFLKKGATLGQTTWAVAADKPDMLILLLNKLMEDGNVLYKKNRIKDAATRYNYALKKFPRELGEEHVRTFKDLKLNLLLNLSRCKRKLNDCEAAVDLATKALGVKPNCFEAYYARARAKRDNRQFSSALEDLKEALKLAPNNRELQRLLIRVRDECREQMKFENATGSRHSLNDDGKTDRRAEETAL
ncbi:hypothetical protein FSP39_013189 [Pinctada imbricata]|uniref:RING-type domain-containing protein n=1 Tax=Pinctada imbricata TaxID=66713 RepID=A0AA88YJ21_PINIB|nr:hypothetical protein FSP39_013189 [Pinctada imbricata]